LLSGTLLNLLITPLVFWLTSHTLFDATTGFGTPGKEEVSVVDE
jgi:hypothetical protein